MQVLRYTVVGLVLVAALAGLIYWFNMGSQVRLNAEVIRVRAIATSESTSVLIAEVRIVNPARVPFVVREVKVDVTGPDGKVSTGDLVAQNDLDRLLSYYPAEGPRYNETLKVRSRIGGSTTQDWTVAASCRISEGAILNRRALSIEIEDVDGVRVRLTEKR